MVQVIQVSVDGDRADWPDGTVDAVRRLPPGYPLVVLIHGFKYSPLRPDRDPHRLVLAASDVPGADRARPWPQKLGLRQGLIVGFGWDAVGTIWQAQARAARAGRALAGLAEAAGRPIDVMGHSLGARVALSALSHLRAGAVRRAILISGAEFRSRAAAALDSPAGRTAEVVNVCSRENDVFDALYEGFVAPHRPLDRAIGAGLGRAAANWLDLQLDAAEVRRGLDPLGFRIPPPDRRVCHRSGYMRSGTWPLYRAIVEGRVTLEALRRAVPETVEPRWSRLFDRAQGRPGLPEASSAPS